MLWAVATAHTSAGLHWAIGPFSAELLISSRPIFREPLIIVVFWVSLIENRSLRECFSMISIFLREVVMPQFSTYGPLFPPFSESYFSLRSLRISH